MTVYIVENSLGHVKVGVARNVPRRLQALQCASSTKLTLLGAVPGGYELEKALHQRWAPFRLIGEWFQKTPPVAAGIEALLSAEPLPEQTFVDDRPMMRAVTLAGGQTALARALGLKQAHVWWWLNRSGRVPAEQVIPIEAATGVTRHDLRPDLYPNDARAA